MSVRYSVVIPTYNREHIIGVCLRSVLERLGPDDEVIVVDDGGSDNTEAVVRAMGGRVRFIRRENGGPGAARNTGIEAACGGHIALLDSDDVWLPWTVDVYDAALRERSDVAMVSGEAHIFRRFEELATLAPDSPVFRVYPDIFAGCADRLAMLVTGALFRADVLKNSGGFITERINAEDGDLLLRIGAAGPMMLASRPAVFGFGRQDGRGAELSLNIEKTHAGMRMLLDREARGVYGGAERRRDRLKYITASVRAASVAIAGLGDTAKAWDLYRRTLGANVELGRIKYLLGYPAIAAGSSLRRAMGRG